WISTEIAKVQSPNRVVLSRASDDTRTHRGGRCVRSTQKRSRSAEQDYASGSMNDAPSAAKQAEHCLSKHNNLVMEDVSSMNRLLPVVLIHTALYTEHDRPTSSRKTTASIVCKYNDEEICIHHDEAICVHHDEASGRPSQVEQEVHHARTVTSEVSGAIPVDVVPALSSRFIPDPAGFEDDAKPFFEALCAEATSTQARRA
ncbi:hypothetical protein BD626DRAFT_539343, partial [Schizophyllum amplum]